MHRAAPRSALSTTDRAPRQQSVVEHRGVSIADDDVGGHVAARDPHAGGAAVAHADRLDRRRGVHLDAEFTAALGERLHDASQTAGHVPRAELLIHEGGHREADGAEGRGEHAIGITTLKVGDAEVLGPLSGPGGRVAHVDPDEPDQIVPNPNATFVGVLEDGNLLEAGDAVDEEETEGDYRSNSDDY